MLILFANFTLFSIKRIFNVKGIFFILILGLLLPNISAANSFDWFKLNPEIKARDLNPEYLPKEITMEMLEKLLSSQYITSEYPMTIFPYKGKFLAVLSCRFEVLEWNGEEWINLYLGSSSGFNCKSHYFIRDDKLYSHGRYGLWTGQSEVLEFDFIKGEWDNVQVKNMPMNFSGSGIYVTKDKIVVLRGQYVQESNIKRFLEKQGYSFDFKSKEWKPLEVVINGLVDDYIIADYSYDLKDYGISVSGYQAEIGLFIFDKKNSELNFSKFPYKIITDYSMAYAKDNALTFVRDKVFLKYDLDNSQKVKVGYVKVKSSSTNRLYYALGVVFVLLVLPTAGYLCYRKIKVKERGTSHLLEEEQSNTINIPYDELKEIQESIQLLKPFMDQVIEVNQLDEILGLAVIKNMDYRRVRRSRLVKSMNEYYESHQGKTLIQRTKSDIDRRLVYYKITF
jgi:hypothetical protein